MLKPKDGIYLIVVWQISARHFAQHNWRQPTHHFVQQLQQQRFGKCQPCIHSNQTLKVTREHRQSWSPWPLAWGTEAETNTLHHIIHRIQAICASIHTSSLLPPQKTEGTEQEKGDYSTAWFLWYMKIQHIWSNRSKIDLSKKTFTICDFCYLETYRPRSLVQQCCCLFRFKLKFSPPVKCVQPLHCAVRIV